MNKDNLLIPRFEKQRNWIQLLQLGRSAALNFASSNWPLGLLFHHTFSGASSPCVPPLKTPGNLNLLPRLPTLIRHPFKARTRSVLHLTYISLILLLTACSDSLAPEQEYDTPRASRYTGDSSSSYDDSYRNSSRGVPHEIVSSERGSRTLRGSDSSPSLPGFSSDATRRLRRYSEELVTESRYAYDSIRFGREFSTRDSVLEMVLEFIPKARELAELLAESQSANSADVSSLVLDLNRESRRISYDLRQGQPTQQIARSWERVERLLAEIDEIVRSESRRRTQDTSLLNSSEIMRIVDELDWEVPTLLERAKDEDASSSSLERITQFNGELAKIAEALERELMDQEAVRADLNRLVEGWRSTRDVLLEHDPELFNTDEWNRAHLLVRELQKLLPRSKLRELPKAEPVDMSREETDSPSRYRQRVNYDDPDFARDSRARRSSAGTAPQREYRKTDDDIKLELRNYGGGPFGSL